MDLRDRTIVSILMTTAARNSSVRLLRVGDIDVERDVILFRRAKGDKTLEVALHEGTHAVLDDRGPWIPATCSLPRVAAARRHCR